MAFCLMFEVTKKGYTARRGSREAHGYSKLPPGFGLLFAVCGLHFDARKHDSRLVVSWWACNHVNWLLAAVLKPAISAQLQAFQCDAGATVQGRQKMLS